MKREMMIIDSVDVNLQILLIPNEDGVAGGRRRGTEDHRQHDHRTKRYSV
jgi:hypothetical protein